MKKLLYVLPVKVHEAIRLLIAEGSEFEAVVDTALNDLPAEKTKAVRFWARLYHRATLPDGGGPLDPDDSDEDYAVDDEPNAGYCLKNTYSMGMSNNPSLHSSRLHRCGRVGSARGGQ